MQHRRRQHVDGVGALEDRKSTRLNSSHQIISYAVFCLKKKKKKDVVRHRRGEKEGKSMAVGLLPRVVAANRMSCELCDMTWYVQSIAYDDRCCDKLRQL